MEQFEKTLRDALANCGKSSMKVAREADLAYEVVIRFAGGGGLHLKSMCKLCNYLGLILVPDPKREKPKD